MNERIQSIWPCPESFTVVLYITYCVQNYFVNFFPIDQPIVVIQNKLIDIFNWIRPNLSTNYYSKTDTRSPVFGTMNFKFDFVLSNLFMKQSLYNYQRYIIFEFESVKTEWFYRVYQILCANKYSIGIWQWKRKIQTILVHFL